ncbi:MAG: hypothetical protein GWP08_10990 [Nitrospiraceae bacterium]|nr:hypothetical protein [Nitrospiraceae bacterium]
MVDFGDRRDYARFASKVHIEVTAPDEAAIVGTASDISATGLYVETDAALSLKTKCSVSMWIGDDRERTGVRRDGVVTRSTATGLGIEFTSIEQEGVQRFLDLLGGESAE